jgi:hypothetical protein
MADIRRVLEAAQIHSPRTQNHQDGWIMITVSENLEEAADRIEKSGWWDGSPYVSMESKFCIATSITCRPGSKGEEQLAIARVLGFDTNLTPNHIVRAIIDWNDTPGRTQQEVLDVMRAAAKLARNDEEDSSSSGREISISLEEAGA